MMQPDYHSLGVDFAQQNKWDEAASCFRQAIDLEPDRAEAHNNLGIALCNLRRFPEAERCFQEAARLKPDYAEAHNGWGVALSMLGKYAEGEAHYFRAVALKPDYVEAHYNLGNALLSVGKLDEAAASYTRTLQLRPDYAEVHTARAEIWLRQGDFERGWPEYEWRWWRGHSPPRSRWRPFQQPLWDGSALSGRTILLHCEQGIGDTIQFVRFASLVKQRGAGRVLVECQEPLVSLLESLPVIDQVIARKPQDFTLTSLPPFDTQAPLMSLPGIYHTTLAAIPADIPYLFANPNKVAQWRDELQSARGAKVGIAWQGNPRHPHDFHRSVRLDCFEPLGRIEGVHLVSLQKGPGIEQLTGVDDGFSVIAWGHRFISFEDTAAAIMALDLVITVDSAVAHCAGALGVPVWTLLPFVCDWRWLSDREDSPWYPSMRLFRQPKPCEWNAVFDRIHDSFAKWLSSRPTP
jgi:Flp pilus assembly protein TadD